MVKQIISKAFFGKNNCLKAYLNENLDFYFEFGKTEDEKTWSWKKVKMNDDELGQILNVLENNEQSVSFFHDYKGEKTQIWINKKDKFLFIKVKELSKSLTTGEQFVLRELIKYAILRINMNI
ncbi:hypothetical protein COV13_04430 [Candidatus Woesearchaeota archaeon CG10_big_fil_rev_8_21_14_0_10_32_9]|nr:MAG: hypothetical protein COV13_04430 [Candidatus Woesearchaeota archaeon CG10_big_fil_rev_8_21_14_0_10_32_9]